jgi:hypothetical protein
MMDSQVILEEVQECSAPVCEVEKWRLSPQFDTGEREEIPIAVARLPKAKAARAVPTFKSEPIYAYVRASLAATRRSDERIWLTVAVCGVAVLLISLAKAFAV